MMISIAFRARPILLVPPDAKDVVNMMMIQNMTTEDDCIENEWNLFQVGPAPKRVQVIFGNLKAQEAVWIKT